MTALDAHDVMRLLLLESAVDHLYDAGVIDERRVDASVERHLPCDTDGSGRSDEALENAYRCLAALRRLDGTTDG